MNPEKHPRGLNPQDRKEFNSLAKRLLELYDKMTPGATFRKLVSGGDGKNLLVLFRGTEVDAMRIANLLED